MATSNTDGILVRSRDGADTWDELGFSTSELAIDPNDPDIVYTVSSFYTDDYIYRYNDAWGDGWSKTDITPDEGIFLIHDIAVDKSSRLYVASYDGLWRYEESASTHFNNLPTQDIPAIDIDVHSNPETIYIGANGEGVYLSQDGGATWNGMNEGLEVLSINVLEISASQPKILYAGTRYGGVWTIELDSTAPEWKKIFVPTLFSGET